MTRCVQRWLLLRLDLFGNTLVLGICLFAAGLSKGQIDPSKVGVVLTYTLSSKYIQRFLGKYLLSFTVYHQLPRFSVSVLSLRTRHAFRY